MAFKGAKHSMPIWLKLIANKKSALVLIFISLTGLWTIKIKPAWASGDSWMTKAPMHEARGGLGVAVVNGKVYAIGGSTERGWTPVISGIVGTNEEYDPTTDTWTFKAPMPTPRARFAISVYQDKVYCIGGTAGYSGSSGYEFTGANEVYDPATDTWETKAPMPTARDVLQANVVGGKIYLIGGYPNGTLNEVYDPENDSWTNRARTPTGAIGYSSAVTNNKIYVVGGYSPPVFWSDLNRIYDPATDKWSLGASAPSSVYMGSAGVTTGVMAPKRIYVMGVSAYSGEGAPPSHNRIYDPEKDSWTVGADVPTSRLNLAVAVVNDIIYVIGGHTHTVIGYIEPSALNEVYTPIGYGTVPPIITIFSPNNKTYNTSDVPLTFAVNKPTSQLEYKLDGLQEVAITGNTTLNGLSNGAHNLTVYATDAASNTAASETITFNIIKEAETPQPPLEEPFPTSYSMGFVALIILALLISIIYILKRKW
jgi:N-acetylneuraminic acid mutarotase